MPASPPFRDTETSTGWEGVKAHPDAPAGGSGPGFSRPSHSHEEKSLWGGVSEFLDAGIHGVESIGDSVYHVAADAVNGATEMEEGCENVFLAVERAKNYAGGAILESTGFELIQLRDGLVEALLFSLAILVLSTSIGAVAGGILVGLVSAGTGTAVGLATGADVGLDIGLAILNWLGIAFLMVYVATHLQTVMSLARRGVSLAWVAGRNPNHEREADIEAAARMLSKAAGEFFGIVLQGIVLYVMHEVGTSAFNRVTSSERYAEVMASLIDKLKRSRLGEGFANFIERNFPKLLETAAQRRKAETEAGGGGGGGDAGGGSTGGQGAATTASRTVTRTSGQNTVKWTVDSQNRPIKAEAQLRQLFSGASRSSSERTAQSNVADLGNSGDVGGHIVGHRFVQNQGAINMFPQEANFNNSAYRTMENEMADWIKQGKQVNAEFTLSPPGAARPDTVGVVYEVIDPATGEEIYNNAQTFKNNAGQVFNRVPSGDMPSY